MKRGIRPFPIPVHLRERCRRSADREGEVRFVVHRRTQRRVVAVEILRDADVRAFRAIVVFFRIRDTAIELQIRRERLLPPQVARDALIIKSVIERIGVGRHNGARGQSLSLGSGRRRHEYYRRTAGCRRDRHRGPERNDFIRPHIGLRQCRGDRS